MRKPDQNGRSFESARPSAIAGEANSRTPKWKLRPERSPGVKSPAPSNVSRVFVEGARSAAPPPSPGPRSATAGRSRPEGAAGEPRPRLRDGVQYLAGGVPARDALFVRREGRESGVPPGRQLAALDA